MYETFYHLNATPFRLTPDPKFCFSHSGYAEARAYLQYAFELGEGFILLTGRPGAGKTTLIESFLKELAASNVATARIAVANLETSDLLRAVGFGYDIEAEGLDKATLLRRIAQHFSTLIHRGRRVLLVIDEAQGLSHSALEELRLLADLQEGARPLLQIFLVGQEKLRDLMREPDMEQLQQRVVGACRLGPMGLAETRYYIRHRLCRAGWTGDPELTGAAILAIFQYSGGVPRHINKLCTRLLLQGFLESRHILDKDDVLNIAGELDAEQLAPVSRGQQTLDAAADDAGLLTVLPNDPISVSDLALRVPQGRIEPPPPSVPSAAEKNAPAAIARNEPAPAEGVRLTAPCPPPRTYVRPNTAQPERSAVNAVRRTPRLLAARVLPGLFQLQDQPAVLFAVVAAVTVTAAAVTSYVENRAAEQAGLLAVNTQPWQSGLSASDSDGSHEAADPRGAPPQPGFPGQEGLAVVPGQGVAGQLDDVLRQEVTGVVVASRAAPRSAPVSAAAVEVSPVAEADQGDNEPDGVAQPAGDDAALDVQDKVESASLVAVTSGLVAPPDKLGADDQAQVITAAPPDAVPPAADAAVATDTPSPVGPAVPATSDSSQPLSSEHAVVAVVSSSERIAELLLLAEEALREDRLLIPEQRSAYNYYQQVLSLEPASVDARNGLEQIVERYIALARDAIQRQDAPRAQRYIARALRVRPRDQHLLALQDSVKTASASVQQPEYQPPAVPPASASQETEPPKNVFQRLKDFFSRNSSGAREEQRQELDGNW